jgi:hypothetical protein
MARSCLSQPPLARVFRQRAPPGLVDGDEPLEPPVPLPLDEEFP